MTNHRIYVVVILDGGSVIQQLLKVVVIVTLVILLYCTACRVKLTIVGVVDIGIALLIKIDGSVDGQHQSRIECKVCKTIHTEGMTLVVTRVQTNILNRVGIADERACQAGIDTATIVHHLNTITVNHDAAVSIAYIGRIDRSNLRSIGPDITCRGARTIVTE